MANCNGRIDYTSLQTHAWGKFKSFEQVGGQWSTLSVAQATAEAVCQPQKRDVTITINSLGKKFGFQIPHGVRPPDTGIGRFSTPDTPQSAHRYRPECNGTFITKNVEELTTGPEFYVDYTNTRVMILEKENCHPVAVVSQFLLSYGALFAYALQYFSLVVCLTLEI